MQMKKNVRSVANCALLALITFWCAVEMGQPALYLPMWNMPEQVHISLATKPSEMVVTWVTLNRTNEPGFVRYGEGSSFSTKMNRVAPEQSMNIHRSETREIFVYRATLGPLKSKTKYKYQIYSGEAFSNVFFFRTINFAKSGGGGETNLVILGDLGNEQAETIKLLTEEIHNVTFRYDAMLHVGDFAYDLWDDQGRVGDAYFREIEPFAAYIPYQTAVGNHEQTDNFSHYNNLFSMHSQDESDEISNFFWSYDIGLVHVISLSTEFYYFTNYGTTQIGTQYRWLQQDLRRAFANRAAVPWIITMAHRPMYNQYYINNLIRIGNDTVPGWEPLFLQYGVDVSFWGHDHIYERIFPMNDAVIQKGSDQNPYDNPNGITHITTGSAGCFLTAPPTNPNLPKFSAFVNRDFSYTRVKIFNKTHMRLQQVSKNKGGRVIDEIMIIRNEHGPYAKPNKS